MQSKVVPRNEHAVDRILRIVVGIGLLTVAFIGPRTPWGFLGILPLLTGVAGFCPGYKLFGVSTCPDDNC